MYFCCLENKICIFNIIMILLFNSSIKVKKKKIIIIKYPEGFTERIKY